MSRGVRLFALLVGAMDASTGILLMASPALTLRWMGLSPGPSEGTIFLRFVGVFVASVGSLYLIPSLAFRGRAREWRLRAALEATVIVRSAVCLFVGASVVSAAMELPWISVALTDGVVAAIQIGILRGLADAA